MTRLSQAILENLLQAVNGLPALETERGKLFVGEHGVAAIQLKVAAKEYAVFASSIPENKRPGMFELIPVDRPEFSFVILKKISLVDGKTFLDNREVVLL